MITSEQIQCAIGLDPSQPARTTRMICDALAEAASGKRVAVVCGNQSESGRIRDNAKRIMSSALDSTQIEPCIRGIKFVCVDTDPVRILRGTRGVRVFIDHFAMGNRNAIEWLNMARERS